MFICKNCTTVIFYN